MIIIMMTTIRHDDYVYEYYLLLLRICTPTLLHWYWIRFKLRRAVEQVYRSMRSGLLEDDD